MKVVGLDLSTTNSGVAVIVNGSLRWVTNVKSNSKDWSGDYDGRFNRMSRTVRTITSHCTASNLIVIEGPSYSSHAPGTWDRAGLFWTVYGTLRHCGLWVAVVPPTVRAKWATGKGGAGKAAVAVACGRLFPDADIVDDNGADAAILAAMGSQWMGQPVARMSEQRKAVLEGVEWPTRS